VAEVVSSRNWQVIDLPNNGMKGIPQTETTHAVERFTRTAPDTIM